MKNFIRKMVFMLVLILGTGLALFAQGAESTDLAVPQLDLMTMFATFGAFVASIPVIVQALKQFLVDSGGKYTDTEKIIVQYFSWFVGVVLAMVGWYLKLGFLAGLSWYYALAYGAAASLSANGFQKQIKLLFAILFKKK